MAGQQTHRQAGAQSRGPRGPTAHGGWSGSTAGSSWRAQPWTHPPGVAALLSGALCPPHLDLDLPGPRAEATTLSQASLGSSGNGDTSGVGGA